MTVPEKFFNVTARPPLTLWPFTFEGFWLRTYFFNAAETRLRADLLRFALRPGFERLRLRQPFSAAARLAFFVIFAIYLSIPSARISYEPPENSSCSSRTR